MKSCSQRAGAINSYTTSSIGLSETSSSIPVRTSHPNCQRLLDQCLTRRQCRRICDKEQEYGEHEPPNLRKSHSLAANLSLFCRAGDGDQPYLVHSPICHDSRVEFRPVGRGFAGVSSADVSCSVGCSLGA